jgi:DMSO/TMAO reductase YedYZ molybdopterin-dependent catalytic subunit
LNEQKDLMSEKQSLPPQQQLAAQGKWPIVGEKSPRRSDAPWLVSVGGLVAAPKTWTLDEIAAMPRVERLIDIHCVTRWSKPCAQFGGVPLSRLLDQCQPSQEARFISFMARSEQNHSTSLALEDALRLDALVALEYEGEPLEAIHGGPIRIVVPGKYFYKSVKWLEHIELLAEDRLGYWEKEAGYHNEADPWREQRYIAPNLDKKTLKEALAKRDFAGKNFQSLDARGLDLAGLNARGALLRAANFQRINLERACFDEANLSNASLEGSDLRRATFLNADVEGANFRGADLRGADFTGASIFGATFCEEEGGGGAESFGPSRLDPTTRIDEAAIDALTPLQQSFVRRSLDA